MSMDPENLEENSRIVISDLKNTDLRSRNREFPEKILDSLTVNYIKKHTLYMSVYKTGSRMPFCFLVSTKDTSKKTMQETISPCGNPVRHGVPYISYGVQGPHGLCATKVSAETNL